jgi:hypothetical protein
LNTPLERQRARQSFVEYPRAAVMRGDRDETAESVAQLVVLYASNTGRYTATSTVAAAGRPAEGMSLSKA